MSRETRRLIGEKARKLRFIGEALAREEAVQQELTWKDFRRKRQYRSDMNRYKKCVLDLEDEYKQLVVCMRERGENPLFSYLKLLGGVLALFLSIIWVIHIILNCLVPQLLNVSPIDNHIFGFLDAMLKVRIREGGGQDRLSMAGTCISLGNMAGLSLSSLAFSLRDTYVRVLE